MKNNSHKISLLISVLLITITSFSQSCLPDGISFNNQIQIDSFKQNYPGCIEIEGWVWVEGHEIFNLFGLNEIIRINGDLGITNADSLINLQGLNNLCEIGGQFWIGYYGPNGNMSLEDFSGVERLKRVELGLVIVNNYLVKDFTGFDSLRYVYNLEIGPNQSLNSLYGLNSLDSVDYGLIISGTDSLINCEGLNNLSYINHSLSIAYNESLTSLNGLDNLNEDAVDSFLNIRNNPSLSQCAAESICNILSDSTTTVSIYNNSNGCNNPEEVMQACLVKSPIHEFCGNNISIFPNPTSDKIRIELKDDINIIEIKIFDITGKLKHRHNGNSTEIDMTMLNSGIYIVEIKTSNRIIRKKIKKE